MLAFFGRLNLAEVVTLPSSPSWLLSEVATSQVSEIRFFQSFNMVNQAPEVDSVQKSGT
jgi:hypothetical protein